MTVADVAASGSVDSSGNATLRFQPTRSQTWTVTQVSVDGSVDRTHTVGGGSECGVYRDSYLICPVIATGDSAGGDPPIKVSQNQVLSVRWRGASPGAPVSVMVVYDDGN